MLHIREKQSQIFHLVVQWERTFVYRKTTVVLNDAFRLLNRFESRFLSTKRVGKKGVLNKLKIIVSLSSPMACWRSF